MSQHQKQHLWEEYILWSATPPHERGETATEQQWAEAHGYTSSRTMRQWKTKTEFKDLQQKLLGRMMKNAADSDTLEELELGDVDFSDERDYLLVKTQLLNSAKSGNLKATELFMKLYGKSWIDEESASRNSDYSTQDLEKLVAIAVASLAPEKLASALTAAGWSVAEPA
jgi:hypothetical protein